MHVCCSCCVWAECADLASFLEHVVDELGQQFADAVVFVDELFERSLQRLLHHLRLLEARLHHLVVLCVQGDEVADECVVGVC